MSVRAFFDTFTGLGGDSAARHFSDGILGLLLTWLPDMMGGWIVGSSRGEKPLRALLARLWLMQSRDLYKYILYSTGAWLGSLQRVRATDEDLSRW